MFFSFQNLAISAVIIEGKRLDLTRGDRIILRYTVFEEFVRSFLCQIIF